MFLACARDNSINFVFDINGNSIGPNKWGVDLFDFDLGSDNKLDTNFTCNQSNCGTYFGVRTTHVMMGLVVQLVLYRIRIISKKLIIRDMMVFSC